jgi:site-specific DNA recombinase
MDTSPDSTAQAGSAPVDCSVRYLRVSSKRQMDTDADIDPEGNSIDTQRKATVAKERALGTVNVGEYVEPGNSALSISKRPEFRKMLERIMQQRDVRYVVIYQRSRAFRNFADAVIVKRQLEKLGVKLISAKEDFGEGVWADAMEGITDIFNEVQVRLNGQDIAIKMGNKVKNGGTVGKAKLGYLNDTKLIDGHRINTISLDPERSKYIPLAFELFASGRYTIHGLRDELSDAGLTMPADARRGHRPISTATLGKLLRDRYYVGEVLYKGIWYPGRHEALVGADLFDRVQRVLDTHSGSGARYRTHKHYLKGLLWCARCHSRLTIQRALGNGGEYFYFLCRGKQEHRCDLPYVPVEIFEKAVADYYATDIWLPAEIRDQLRGRFDEAMNDSFGLSEEMRADFAEQLERLDQRENYFLDLAAEEGWPKDKLRQKITAIRTERTQIQRSLDQAGHELETGRQVFYQALELLDEPAAMYGRSGEAVRAILNRTFFTRFYVDAQKVMAAELREPFDVLNEAYRLYKTRQARTYQRRVPVHASKEARSAAVTAGAPQDRTTVIDSLASVFGQGWSKPVMVGATRIEPVTPRL